MYKDLSIEEKIIKLKKSRKAVILVHNYQPAEIQDIADYLGDSLGLSQKAADSDAEVILFCGVRFMAETASILCPNKMVLIPDLNAGCPMANMITAKDLLNLKKLHPKAAVVCYVNSTAEVKAESDICCTSSNAVKVVNSIEVSEVIFIPDKYLANYVSTQTDKKIIAWEGFCPTHVRIQSFDILNKKKLHPKAMVLVHPECRPEVIALADKVLSTGGMCDYIRKSNVLDFVIGTETGLLHRLKKENPVKNFYPASDIAVCPNMKKLTLEKILWSLENLKENVKVTEKIRVKAKKSVDKMLNIY